jgi:SWIM zinc finger
VNLTEEQVLDLAPDDSSKKAGKDLSNASKWQNLGITEQAMWGECQGSGSKPYATQIDIQNLAFKCSCPSRKFPCKHGLGLLLLHSKQNNLFNKAEAPTWVSEWINKRVEKSETKTEKKTEIVDEAAQEKRKVARTKSIEDGIEELNLWLKDIVRNGIIGIPEKDFSFFYNMQKRLVDAKAPGLGNMVKALGNINFYAEGWESLFVEQLARIYLVTKGFINKDQLPQGLQNDMDTFVGLTISQEALKENDGITDSWFVLAKQVFEEDNITTERIWLQGKTNNQFALILQFSVRGQGVAITLTPGIYIEAELVYFPATKPLRAIIKRQMNSNNNFDIVGLQSWKQVTENENSKNIAMPISTELPHIINNVKLVQQNKQWFLADAENNIVHVKENFTKINNLLAITGGKAAKLSVIGKENNFEPLGIFINQKYIAI